MPTARPAETDSPRSRRAALLVLFGALGGLNWGYDTGVMSTAVLFLREEFALDSWAEGWVVTGLILGAILGAAGGGRLSDRHGRRPVLMAAAAAFVVAPIGMAAAPTAAVLLAFRVLVGLGAGLAAVTLPVYLSEIAPARIRGRVTATYVLAIVSGQLLGFLVGLAFTPEESWRWMLGLSVVPSVLFAAGLAFIRETPRWLVTKGREEEAREILRRDRSAEEAAAELEEIHAIRRAEQAAGAQTLTVLLRPWVRPILLVGLVVAVLQQIMGANAIIYYAPTTLQNVGFSDQAAVASNLIIGVMNVLAVWLALTVADRWGRRPLLLVGAAGMALSLGVLAVTNLVLPAPDGFGVVGLVTLACMAAYIFLFQASWGSITWVVLGEIFPLRVRAVAMAVATTALWIGNGVVALGFPPLLEAVGVGWAFAGFAVICCAGLAFTWRRIPETKGRSLEEIETSFHDDGDSGDADHGARAIARRASRRRR